MDWLLLFLLLLMCATSAGLGYFVGWQRGWAEHKSLETPTQSLSKMT